MQAAKSKETNANTALHSFHILTLFQAFYLPAKSLSFWPKI